MKTTPDPIAQQRKCMGPNLKWKRRRNKPTKQKKIQEKLPIAFFVSHFSLSFPFYNSKWCVFLLSIYPHWNISIFNLSFCVCVFVSILISFHFSISQCCVCFWFTSKTIVISMNEKKRMENRIRHDKENWLDHMWTTQMMKKLAIQSMAIDPKYLLYSHWWWLFWPNYTHTHTDTQRHPKVKLAFMRLYQAYRRRRATDLIFCVVAAPLLFHIIIITIIWLLLLNFVTWKTDIKYT